MTLSDSNESSGKYIHCNLGVVLEQRSMTLLELSDRVGVTVANLSKLKNNRAKAIRFSTLLAICEVLECTPGDLLSVDES
ncbi:helix-turn-helix domain-containing protein [Rothia nasimurium]|uniref:helix-turn-helix domain-containing protein n=1 Tax=Rothia nasimurium TaxID=85336 RepID=UPI001F3811DA|nr:helix-turn-helix transcriptional regulator [Rothia nasimurium]